MKLFAHLNFGGNCEEAFRYYEAHLGGRLTMVMKASELPPEVEARPGSPEAIVHARMDIAGVELIGNDVPPQHFKPMQSSYLYLATDTAEDADRIYTTLAEQGHVGIPIGETFFASRFGQLRDRFGTLWTILHERVG